MEVAREIGPAQQRWNQMRLSAGYRSDRALERALSISGKPGWQVNHWIHRGKEPTLDTLRRLKQLLGVSIDDLDVTIVSWRAEVAAKHGGAARERTRTDPSTRHDSAAAQPAGTAPGPQMAEGGSCHQAGCHQAGAATRTTD